MSERLVLSPAASTALAALSRALLAATRTASLYPGEHPVVRASVGRVQQAIAAGAEAGIVAAIAVTPSSLLIGGIELASETNASDRTAALELASLLHRCGILEIGFDSVVPPEAIQKLVAFLARLSSAAVDPDGSISEAWLRDGHAAVRIEAVDYRTLLAERACSKQVVDQDGVWRALVAALRAGRQSFDAAEQQRLMDLAGDADAVLSLASTLTAEQCTPDGSPLLTTQAATILSCFRHLASVAAVIAPGRAQEVLRNVAAALSRLDPHVALQVLTLDKRAEGAEAGSALSAALDEEAIARIMAAAVALDGTASPRLVQVFGLLVPDRGGQRRVLARARAIAAEQATAVNGSAAAVEALWNSIEERLLAHDDEPFVSDDYRAVLDAHRSGQAAGPAANLPELEQWLDTLGEESIRHLSMALLTDLLRLEPATDRAVVVLNHLAAMAEDFMLAGAFEEALRVFEAITASARRDDLATAVAQVLARLGSGTAFAETAATIEDLSDDDWLRLEYCYLEAGPPALVSLERLIAGEHETRASERAGRVVTAMAEESVAFLSGLLTGAGTTARLRIATLLGGIGGPAAIPPLQTLLRSSDPRVLQRAVAALAGIDDPAAARALHVALAATDGDKREAVVNALVAANDRSVVPLLVRLLAQCQPLGADFQVALHVLDALGRLADPRGVGAITRVMMLRSWRARRRLRALKRASVQALSRITDASARGALDEASRSGDRMLRGMLRAGAATAAGVA
jgi:hypothetical protein